MITTVVRTIMAVAVMAALSACQPAVGPNPAATDHAARLGPVLDRLIATYNTRDYSQIDTILSADFQRTAPDENAAGPAEMQAVIDQIHKAYADFKIEISERAFAQDLAFVRWTVTGNYTGDAGAVAAGRPVNVTGATMFRFRDGKIAHEFVYFDSAAVTTQLGIAQVPHASP